MSTNRGVLLGDLGYALLITGLFVPTVRLLGQAVHWLAAVEIAIWAVLTGYMLLVVRRANCRHSHLVCPLVLLLTAALSGVDLAGFAAMCLLVLAWLRSVNCYRLRPVRAVMAESVAVFTGLFPLAVFGWSSLFSLAIGIGCFVAVQPMYRLFLDSEVISLQRDPFERALDQAVKLLAG